MLFNHLKFFAVFILSTLLLTTSASASPFVNFLGPNQHLIADVGGFVAHQGTSQHIGINTLIGDYFSVSKHNDGNALFGLGYYRDWGRIHQYAIQYGIQAFYFVKPEVKGKVTQENLFTNLGYRYYTRNIPLYLVGKAILEGCPCQQLTGTLGLGVNFLKTTDFKEYSLDGITLPDHPFSSKNKTVFSAMIGLGWRFTNAFNQYPVELSYRFFYLNQGHFEKRFQVLNNLRTGHSYANALTLSIAMA